MVTINAYSVLLHKPTQTGDHSRSYLSVGNGLGQRCNCVKAVIISGATKKTQSPCHRQRARIVIINAAPTEMDGLADVVLRGGIGELLPALVAGSN